MHLTDVDRKLLTWFRGLGTEPDHLHQTNTRSYDHAARKASEVLGMPPDAILDRMLVLGQEGLVEIVPRAGHKGGIYYARITDEGRQSLRHTAQPADAEGAMTSAPAKTGDGLSYHFHPDIERVSGKLFHDGHFKQAALEAYIRVIEAVREKSGLSLDGDDLMNRVFGSDKNTRDSGQRTSDRSRAR
jgi:hypothetical protein